MKRILICILTVCILCVFAGCKKPNNNTTQPTDAPANEPTAQVTDAPATPTGIETDEDDFTTPDNGGTNNTNGNNGGGNTNNGGNNGGNNNGGSNNNGNSNTATPDAPDATPTPSDDGIIKLPEIGW